MKSHLSLISRGWAGAVSLLVLCLQSTQTPVLAQSHQPTFIKITNAPVASAFGNAHGCAWVDVDNDGWVDLFDVNYNVGDAIPSFLYRNQQNGTFARITNGVLASRIGASPSCAWGDYDNDGFADVFLPNQSGRNWLFHNNGDGTFAEITSGAIATQDGARIFNAAWGDYDNDGNLDLFATGSSGGTNLLYRGHGDGTFTRITNSLLTEGSFFLGCAWADFNNDGWLDLFVVKGRGTDMTQPNRLYRNLGNGSFGRGSEGPVGTDVGNGLGCAWGDYDNDGFLDLFVPNEYGNKSFLYRNDGDGTFTRVTEGPVVNEIGESLAAAWGDYDNDGFLDLFVANGRGASGNNHTNFLYHNNGDGTFSKITNEPPVMDPGLWHGCAWGDYDNDGFMDLFVANWVGFASPRRPNGLYRNAGNSNSWLKVKLHGTISNRSGIGAKVRVRTTIGGVTRWQMRQVSGGDGVIQNGILAHFGLSNATSIDVVRVEWPSGIVTELTNIMPRQVLTIKEAPRLIRGSAAGEFQLMGGTGVGYCLEATTNLSNWLCVALLTNTQAVVPFSDSNAPLFPLRFYRARRQ